MSDGVKLKQLEKELAYYTSLLNKHESVASQKTPLQSSCKKFTSSHWRPPAFPVHKTVKNSFQLINSSKPRPSSSNLQLNETKYNKLVPNKRTVVFNQNNYIKTKPEVSNSISENIELSVNKSVGKRTVINSACSNSVRKVLLNSESSCRKINIASSISGKINKSCSKDLLNEIQYLNQLIKSNENKSKMSVSNAKTKTSRENIANNFVVHKEACRKSANKYTCVMPHNFNGSNASPVTTTVNLNSSSILSKQSCKNEAISHVSAHLAPKSRNISKYSLKNVGMQQTSYSKINQPPKVLNNKVDRMYNFNKSNFNVQQEKIIQNSNSIVKKTDLNIIDQQPSSPVLKTKANLTLAKITATKRSKVVRGSSYKLVNKNPSPIKSPVILKAKISPVHKGKSAVVSSLKSPVIYKVKSPSVSKGIKARAVYTKLNKEHIVLPKKKHNLKDSFTYHNASASKMKNAKSKYKVVNKLVVALNKDALKKQNSSKKSSLAIDKSESFELLDDSTVDNLEQRLLAISTSLTAAVKPVTTRSAGANRKSPGHITSKANSKFCQRKTPLKKQKVLSSKYKVVNGNVGNKIDSKVCLKKTKYKVVNKNGSTPLRLSLKRRNSIMLKTPAKRLCKKVVFSKFSIVNKHLSMNMTPKSHERSILVKRLYKSKNRIINKNTSPIYNSAKLIKSKYLTLNKRRLPSYHNYISYPKVQMRVQRYKGHFKNNKLQTKPVYSNGARRFSKNNRYLTNLGYRKNSSRPSFKSKPGGYNQVPVLLIRGARYSLSSSGKTLRKLPSKGQTRTVRTPTRILIGGKSYVRTSENVMKVASPISVNFASRVLHRSINRVLIASTKKNLSKVNTYCMFYNRFGRCNRGVKCPYIHDPSKIAVCTRFLRGTCKIEGCPFSHEVAPGKMAICSFFLVDACEKNDCPYRHEQLPPAAVLCKAFVQGYCPNGKECKKAHILICPKFILGECDKGSSCAFPHPPQKARKVVQKEPINENELKKEDDILLEKVARYFQPLCQMSSKNIPEESETIKFCVLKQRKLEEQPAFIPLSESTD